MRGNASMGYCLACPSGCCSKGPANACDGAMLVRWSVPCNDPRLRCLGESEKLVVHSGLDGGLAVAACHTVPGTETQSKCKYKRGPQGKILMRVLGMASAMALDWAVRMR